MINLDFADVTSVMKDAGLAHMGVGHASGKDKAEMAAKAAISSPLLETSIDSANGVIINVTSSPDIGLDEIDTAANMVREQADPNANIIWGAAFDENMEDEMTVTVIATGFDKEKTSAVLDGTAAKAEHAKAAPVAPAAPAAPKVPDPDAFLAEINKIFRD